MQSDIQSASVTDSEKEFTLASLSLSLYIYHIGLYSTWITAYMHLNSTYDKWKVLVDDI